MPPRVLVPLAPGAEEMETVIVVDVLRRAGCTVQVAGLDGAAPVRCSRGIVITPDGALSDLPADAAFDAIVLPGGGEGAGRLAAHPALAARLRAQEAAGRLLGAICAGPTALVAAGVGRGRRLTSHPGVRAQVASHGEYREERVVADGPVITSRGPGTAFEFALALVAALQGDEAARKVAEPMLVRE